jgi:dihydrolipoamide dehydrogenase
MGADEQMGDYNLIPRAVYSFPEVASVGKNETKCKEEGIDFEVGKAYFRTNGRSVAHNENIGEVRVIKEASSGKVQGVTMVGASVTELIASARAIMGSTEDIIDISFAHPTVSEVLKEAWEDAYGISLHVPPKK